jgi:menaquinone-9 beta-reductase
MSDRNRRVCVVGGGPAGLAASIVLARTGYEVVVVDCATLPIDKACGEGLMPDSLHALAGLGVAIPSHAGFAFRGIRFADAHSSVYADFPDGMGKGVRRPILHELLWAKAASLGVSLLWNSKHVHLTEGGVSADGKFIEASLVVAADGQNSSIRRQAGLDRVRREKRRYGFRRHYRMAPWSSYMELHWGPRSQIYMTPVAADELCIAVISRDPKLRLEEALLEAPELRRRLAEGVPVSVEMGGLSISRRFQRVQQGDVLLAGDASGSVDAITGEGMCLAFKQALLLERVLLTGDLRQYNSQHGDLMNLPEAMSALMLLLESSTRLRRKVLAGLAAHPEIFGSFLAVHVGASPFRDLLSWRLLDFGRAFLTA